MPYINMLQSKGNHFKKNIMEHVQNQLTFSNPVYIIYLDYRKAVDSVPHERLLDKEKLLG